MPLLFRRGLSRDRRDTPSTEAERRTKRRRTNAGTSRDNERGEFISRLSRPANFTRQFAEATISSFPSGRPPSFPPRRNGGGNSMGSTRGYFTRYRYFRRYYIRYGSFRCSRITAKCSFLFLLLLLFLLFSMMRIIIASRSCPSRATNVASSEANF